MVFNEAVSLSFTLLSVYLSPFYRSITWDKFTTEFSSSFSFSSVFSSHSPLISPIDRIPPLLFFLLLLLLSSLFPLHPILHMSLITFSSLHHLSLFPSQVIHSTSSSFSSSHVSLLLHLQSSFSSLFVIHLPSPSPPLPLPSPSPSPSPTLASPSTHPNSPVGSLSRLCSSFLLLIVSYINLSIFFTILILLFSTFISLSLPAPL